MSIRIGNYDFEGPLSDPSGLRNTSGVYAVLAKNTTNGNYTVVDIGESGTVRDRVSSHDRANCWARNKQAGLNYAGHYCNEANRMAVEKALRGSFNPPCGDR